MISEDRRIKTRQQLKEYIAADSDGYTLNFRRFFSYIFQVSERSILLKHTVLLRKTEYYTNTGRTLLAAFYHVRLMRFQNHHCIHIPLNSCGKGLHISHVYPIGMNGNVTIGENCRFLPYAKIAGDDIHDFAPQIGDNVTLGIDCIVYGNITIADGIYIGAGAVVNKSFTEPNIAIAGVPAKKIGMAPGFAAKGDRP